LPLLVGQQVVAPANGRGQRLLTRDGGAVATREQPEALVEAFGEHIDRHCPRAGRRELQREWDAVEACANTTDCVCVVGGQRKVRQSRSNPRHEQLDRRVSVQLHGSYRGLVGRRCKRRYAPAQFASDTQRLPAGGQDLEVRTSTQQGVCERRAACQQVLAVVEDQ
jgi:hypothetical protein